MPERPPAAMGIMRKPFHGQGTRPRSRAGHLARRARDRVVVLGKRRMDSRLRGNDGTYPGVVIPAKAGIHRLSPNVHARAPDASIVSVLAVIPAKAGIHESRGGRGTSR